MPNTGEPYRDGRVHVLAAQCSTCIMRPGNLMHLDPGRLRDMTDAVQRTGIPYACHQTLPYAEEKYREHYGGAALCRGAVDAYGDQSRVIRLAWVLDVITEVPAYQETA